MQSPKIPDAAGNPAWPSLVAVVAGVIFVCSGIATLTGSLTLAAYVAALQLAWGACLVISGLVAALVLRCYRRWRK